METKLRGTAKSVTISPGCPTVMIGERINPTGRKRLAEALRAGDLDIVRRDAIAQVEAGAEIIDVNVGAPGVDEVNILPQAVQIVQSVVDVPVSIDTPNPKALAAALAVCQGKPLVNSVNGEERSLNAVLPLVKEHGTAVIGLCMDDNGIPNKPEERLAIARRIIERAEALGIPREDVIIDCLALTVGADSQAARVTLEAVRLVREELGVNLTLGASNISFGLPERHVINAAFLALAIGAGVNCPIVDPAKVGLTILATDLLLGRDDYAARYLQGYRRRKKA